MCGEKIGKKTSQLFLRKRKIFADVQKERETMSHLQTIDEEINL